jgi:hypothetical protein
MNGGGQDQRDLLYWPKDLNLELELLVRRSGDEAIRLLLNA